MVFAELEKRRLGYREPEECPCLEIDGFRCYQWFDGRDNLVTFYRQSLANGDEWEQVPAYETPVGFRKAARSFFNADWISLDTFQGMEARG